MLGTAASASLSFVDPGARPYTSAPQPFQAVARLQAAPRA